MPLVIEKELENITIVEIAEKANVNRGTTYLPGNLWVLEQLQIAAA